MQNDNNENDNLTSEEQLREKLVKVESEIRKIIGTDDPDPAYVSLRKKSREEMEQLEELLLERCGILNNLFQGTEEEMKHFDRVNEHLLHLRNELYRRTTMMKNTMVIDMDFDDVYEIEGTLEFCYNSEESVLTLSNDDFYGTNFQLMISTLCSFYFNKHERNIGFEIGPDQTNILDDGKSWKFIVFDRDMFDDRIVGNAPYNLCFWKHYSIPDLVRLNDFWAEVKLTMQSMTTQSGERYIPEKMEKLRNESKV
ncbi:MAG: hypothetical protein NC453_12155 [Muribaculum sp.]|nr:hypothetical protein [Muribaculum sp.]